MTSQPMPMPTAPDAEMAVLGSVMLSPHELDGVTRILSPGDFANDGHRRVYGHILALAADGAVDPQLLAARLVASGELDRIGGADGYSRILASVAVASHARYYARIVRQHAQWRELVRHAAAVLEQARTPTLPPRDVAARLTDQLHGLVSEDAAEYETDAAGMVQATIGAYERRRDGTSSALETGLPSLDAILGGGIEPGDLVVLGARTSAGKTAFALQLVRHAAVTCRKYVVMYSVEMSRAEIGSRMATSEAGLDGLRVKSGTLDSEQETAFLSALNRIRSAPIDIIDAPHQTAAGIAAGCRRRARKQPLGLVVVDYLQLIGADQRGERWEREVASLSRQMKALAQELRVPVLVLVQLNREADRSPRPRMSHVHGCDAVSHDANVVMLIDRPNRDIAYGRGVGEPVTIYVDKNRNGPCDDVGLLWHRESMRFAEPAKVDVWGLGVSP